MAVSPVQGCIASLNKEARRLTNTNVSLGWKERAVDGADFYFDSSAYLLTEVVNACSDADFIFYYQLKSSDGSAKHTGDELSGGAEGDDETIEVALNNLTADIAKIAFTVTVQF